jgi:hypothetical protein
MLSEHLSKLKIAEVIGSKLNISKKKVWGAIFAFPVERMLEYLACLVVFGP